MNKNIDKLKNAPSNLSNLKSKVDKVDVDKLVPVAVDLSKPSDALKHDVLKKDVYNTKIKIIEDKICGINNLATKASPNARKNEDKGKIPTNTNVVTTAAFTAVENKIPNTSI